MLHLARALAHAVRTVPWVVIAIVLVATASLAVLAADVEVATGNDGFAPENPEILAAETLGERFGAQTEAVVQIVVQAPAGQVVGADGVAAAAALTAAVEASAAADRLAARPGRPAVVTWMAPVFAAAAEQGVDPSAFDEATVITLFEQTLDALPEPEAARVAGLFPPDAAPLDADVALALVFLQTPSAGDGGFDTLVEVQAGVADAVAEAGLPTGFEASAFSFPLLFRDDGTFQRELGRLFAGAFAVIVLILGFVYWLRPRATLGLVGSARRSAADVALTMATIVMAITWMNGIAVLLGPDNAGVVGPLTQVTQIIPVLLIGLGVDYAIHLTARYREAVGAGNTVSVAVSEAVGTVGVALTLATLTTAVGFLTNIVNPVPALRDFGILAAVGITAAFLLMLTFVPACRLLLDRRAERLGRLPREALETTSERILPALMSRVAVLGVRAPVPTLLVTVLVGGGLGLWGLANLDTTFSSTDFVPEDAPILDTFETLQERFAGGVGETTEVLLSGQLATPAAHNALVDAHTELGEVPTVASGGRAGAVTPVTVLRQALAPGDAGGMLDPTLASAARSAGVGSDGRVAPDADVAALYDALLAAAPQAPAVLARDGDGYLGRMALQTTAGEQGAGELRTDLRAALAPMAAAGVTAVPTSNAIVNDVIVSALRSSQVSSLLVTLLVAAVLLMVVFWAQQRRGVLGLLTVAPVALVVLWTFGLMAATGIPFGPVTATIAALAIGIGVPYTIHVTHRFGEDRLRHPDPADALRSTVRHTGGALAGSAFTTCAGFGILVTSSLVPFRQFGLVTVYAIGFALLAATVVLPSMLALWDRWDRRTTANPPGQSGPARPAVASQRSAATGG